MGLDTKPARVDPRLEKFAWVGTWLVVTLTVVFFVLQRSGEFLAGPRPWPLLVGWGVMTDGVGVLGPPRPVLRAALGLSCFALLTALTTHGFEQARGWGQAASMAVGVAGIVAAVPLLVLAGVVLVNLLVWALAIALVVLVSMAWVPILVLRSFRRR